MPKPHLSSASVDTLLKLRDEIEEVLAHRAALCTRTSAISSRSFNKVSTDAELRWGFGIDIS